MKKAQTLGSIVRSLRLKYGMTQERLAFKSGLHRTYISQIERDIKQPTVKNLHKISKALGIKLSELVKQYEKGISN